MRYWVFAVLGFALVGCAGPNAPLVSHRQPNPSGRLVQHVDAESDEAATDPDKAFRWRRLRWLDENGQLAPDALSTALAQRQANLDYWANSFDTRGVDPTSWVERGPFNVGGRTRSLIISPTNPNRLIAGSVGGGIWISNDAGTTWAPANDRLVNLAICCLAIDPNNSNILYAGTGEGFFNSDGLGGKGIYKSTDGGNTWTQLASTAGWDNVCRIAVAPGNSSLILASKRYGGIQRSTNGGASWTNPYWAQGSFYVAFHPTDNTKAIASVIDYDGTVNNWFHRALYSTDGGAVWTPAATGLTRMDDFGSRIELAYTPSQPTIVYGSCAANGGKIWRSVDGGVNYVQQTLTDSSGVSWYANPLWVDPTNPNMLVTGGGSLFRSTDGGVTLQQISSGYIMTRQPHPDEHFVVSDPGFNGTTDRRVYACTDGSIWRTDDIYSASTSDGWINRDAGYRTAQFYGAAGHGPSGLLIGGTQDNGTLRLTATSNQATLTFGGDGGFCAIDPTDPNFTYGEYVTLQIHRSTDGGLSAGYITSGLSDAGSNANFIAPFILDPNNPNRMLAGGRSFWRSDNVKTTASWTAIRAAGSDNISAIAVAPGNSDIVWIGQNNGEIWRTANGTAASPTWTAVDDNAGTNPLPNRYVARILIDPANANTVYVGLGGFAADNLWRTTNGGTNWSDITGSGATGLPNAPIYGIARHPSIANRLFVGTEIGIFSTADGGTNWSTTNQGPASVSVDELVFLSNSNTLLAATHGRGLFTSDVCSQPGQALPPVARNDTATVLTGQQLIVDVLANDTDDDCDRISLLSFDAFSVAGGAIVRVIGGGTGGRDVLRYTPPAAFVGADTFHYTIVDQHALQASATATINVTGYRVPENPIGTLAGVKAAYYNLGPPSALPDFGRLVAYASETVSTVNYPATNGNFAGSGRADNLGAVFTGRFIVTTAGSHTFYTESDDGSALYVDGTRVVNNDGPHGMTEVGGSITLAVGQHDVRIEFYEGGGTAGLIARVQGPGLVKQVIPASRWAAPGVTARYYDLYDPPSALPNFDARKPYASEIVASINYPSTSGNFAGSGRADEVGAVFSGFITVPQTAVYTLSTESDDGSALLIGDQLVVNNDGPHGMTERSGQIALQAGTHVIRVNFYEGGGDCGLIVRIEGGGLSRQIIPPSMWRYVASTGDVNCDGLVNAADVPAFVLALLDPAAYATQYPACNVVRADMNGSGAADGSDIPLFFYAVLGR